MYSQLGYQGLYLLYAIHNHWSYLTLLHQFLFSEVMKEEAEVRLVHKNNFFLKENQIHNHLIESCAHEKWKDWYQNKLRDISYYNLVAYQLIHLVPFCCVKTAIPHRTSRKPFRSFRYNRDRSQREWRRQVW